MNAFSVGGVAVIEDARLRFSQEYFDRRVSSDMPTGDGGLIRQTLLGSVGKLRTRITCETAWQPINLAGLDLSQPVTLQCFEPRIISGTTEVITLPAARRTDSGYIPIGYAMVDGVETSTVITDTTDNVVTLAVVAGADSYHAQYVPELTVYADLSESYASESDRYAWTLDAMET